jgi:pimeloyl-ACP methyl ester carboxylesterase
MRCELDTATIDHEEHGEGRPIVFVHGWTMDRRLEIADYEPIFAKRNGWRRLYFDLPGMGRSVVKTGIRNQDDVLAAVLGFIERVLPGDQRFALAGTSLGGYLARGIAARLQPRIAGLLLRVPAVIPDPTNRTLPAFDPLVRDDALMASLEEGERAALGEVLVQTPAYLDAVRPKVHGLVQPAIAATASVANEIKADPARYGFSFDLAAAEGTFTAPTLIVAARQDTVVGYRDAWDILERYPRATFAVVDRATHTWPVESPALLEALVDDWLARIVQAEKGH